MKLTKELEELKRKLGVLEEVDCSDSETEEYRKMLQAGMPLPEGVLRRNPDSSVEFAMFYTVKKTELSGEEMAEYLQYKQLCTLITVKKCVVFFTVLTIISLICSAIAVLATMNFPF